MEENKYYLELLIQSYQKQIDLYQQIIEDKNAKIRELEMTITSLETLINNRNRVIKIYNNQYNYQTQESDMSNINQTHSGSGDNVGGDKNVPNNPSYDFSGAKFGGGFAGRDYTGDVNNIINEIPDNKDDDNKELKTLLKELIKAIESDDNLDEEDKEEALNQVKKLAEASKTPKDETLSKKAKKAVSFLEIIAKGLEPASKLAKACQKVLPMIVGLLGL